MGTTSIHGIDKVGGRVWPVERKEDDMASYVTLEVTERFSGHEVNFFISDIDKLDELIDHLQMLRRELAANRIKSVATG